MKSLIVLAVLAALAVCNDASFQGSDTLYCEYASLNHKDGKIDLDTYYTELFSNNYRRVGVPGEMQHLQVVFNRNFSTRVTAIALSPQAPFEYSFAAIVNGIGQNSVTVIMNSTVSGGFHYLLQVWGYDTEWL